MRFHLSTPKVAWPVLSFAAVLWATIITGCDSGPNLDDPAVKKQLQARQEAIRKGEEEVNASLKKVGGRRNATIKSIKGRLGAGESSPQ
jgi:hypothetical protein